MMNKFTYLIITILICLTLVVKADDITVKQATKVANSFYFERNNSKQSLKLTDDFIDRVHPLKIHSKTVLYFINFIDGGGLAVSASDATIPIVAYSTKGSFNPDYQPDNFKAWVSQYKTQVYDVINTNKEPKQEAIFLWDYYLNSTADNLATYRQGRSAEPMIESTWDQGIYYNEMCPSDAGGPGGHCLTGCVPTCMGQIANYFRWPETGVGSYSYDGGPYGTLSVNFGESTYNWNEMPASVTDNSLATAQLLYHLGVSCDLVYGPSSSGMYNHKAAYSLRTYFKYSPETQYLYRDSTNLNWDSVIIAHLDQNIPMYYAGWSVPNINGHAFVCDGYQNGNYFHFNWGWSGSYDGYFYTGDLNPGGNNFNLAQELIINCFPDTVNYTYPLYCTGTTTLNSNNGTIDDGSGPIYNYIDNQNCSWLISPTDSVESITLTFYDFEVDITDTLIIYDGGSESSSILGLLTGDNIPDDITSSGDELLVKFKSDNQGASKGWMMGYSSEIPVFCSNNVITELGGEISDGSGPANYQNLTTCIWMIQPENSEEIDLVFNSFNTEAGHDFVTIYDGSDKIGEYSGSELPPVITAVNGMMTIVFSTNSSNTDLGWDAYFSVITGVEEDLNTGLEIFPNPADNMLQIRSSRTMNIKTVKIYNMLGTVVMSELNLPEGITSINTAGLSNGMYIVELSNSNSTFSKKVVIKH